MSDSVLYFSTAACWLALTALAWRAAHAVTPAADATRASGGTFRLEGVLLPVALISGIAISISASLQAPGIARSWSVAIAALFVGLVGYAVAQRFRVPPLILVVSAVVPMLPGISIYRGLSLLGEGSRRDTAEGLVALITAASVALAHAAGVILGEYLAQPLARSSRRVESRLAGPRLVGPLHLPRRQRRRNSSNQTSEIELPKGGPPPSTDSSTQAQDRSASDTTSGG